MKKRGIEENVAREQHRNHAFEQIARQHENRRAWAKGAQYVRRASLAAAALTRIDAIELADEDSSRHATEQVRHGGRAKKTQDQFCARQGFPCFPQSLSASEPHCSLQKRLMP